MGKKDHEINTLNFTNWMRRRYCPWRVLQESRKGLLTNDAEGPSRSRTGRAALWNSLPLTLVLTIELQTFLRAWINHSSKYFKLESGISI